MKREARHLELEEYASPCSTVMSENIEHRALVSELQSLSWSDVKCMAIHLDRMDLPVLDKIEEDHPNDSKQRVMYAMKEWLQRDTEASWKKVVCALRKIQKNALATDIEKEYCAAITTPHPSEPMPLSQSGPQGFAHAQSQVTSSVAAQSSAESSLDHSATPSQDRTTRSPVGSSKLSSVEIQGIKNKAAKLKKRFTSVVIHTKICFIDKEEESRKFLRDFKITLTSLPLFTQYEDKDFLKEEENRIDEAKNVVEIFKILEPYWNYVDYDFLEHIIEEFGTSELQEEMEKYITELDQFEKETTVHDFNSATQGKVIVPAHYRNLAVKLEKDPKRFTLHDVRQFKKSLLNESSLKEYAVLLEGVSCSSVEILLAFPPEAYAKLSEVISASQFRKEHEVVLVVFGEGAAASLPKRQKSSEGELPLVLCERKACIGIQYCGDPKDCPSQMFPFDDSVLSSQTFLHSSFTMILFPHCLL